MISLQQLELFPCYSVRELSIAHDVVFLNLPADLSGDFVDFFFVFKFDFYPDVKVYTLHLLQ